MDTQFGGSSNRNLGESGRLQHQNIAIYSLILFGISHRIGNKLFDPMVFKEWQSEPRSFVAEIRSIAQVIVVAIKEYRTRSLGHSLNVLIEQFGLNLSNLYESVNDFDACVQLIVHHEVAHAYVNQFGYMKNDIPEQDFRAFEFIADMVATSWLCTGLIVNTPDSEGYREMRGFSSHTESIRENTMWVLRAQLIALVFLALAGAIYRGGKVSLEGGSLHPHTYLRYMMQQIHFMTLVLSNFGDAFNTKELEAVDELWREALKLFIAAGLVPADELNVLFDDTRFAGIRRAAAIAQQLDINELKDAQPFLRQLRAFDPKSISEVEALRFIE